MKKKRIRVPVSIRALFKLWKIMRLSVFFLFLFVAQSFATETYSQQTRLTLKMQGVKVIDVLGKIEDETEFFFLFNQKLVDVDRKVDVDVKNVNIDQILTRIFENTNVNYLVKDRQIILTTANSVSSLMQEQKSVSGKITDPSGASLPGVSVVIKGTSTGTITDANGDYTIQRVPETAILQFSFVGMKIQEIAVGSKTIINVTMIEESIGIEEVVAVGYGTMKKKDLTGSVSSISEERLLDRPAINVAQAIGGKVAGVKIIERSGQPGGNAMIRVRGTNSINSNNDPLFVVDGVVGVANALGILNPNEIQSMDVLKDASATAIYGARGSNGVILITTKRGVAGKTQVEYNSYVSRGEMNRKFYVLNAEQMMYVTKQAWMNVKKYATSPNWSASFDASLLPAGYTGKTYSEMPYLFEKTTAGGYSIPLLGKDGNYYKPRFDTNWEEQIFNPSTSTNHQINIRGGSERAKFGAFFGYALEDGLLDNSNFRRYSGKLNGDIKVNDKIDVSANLGINRSKEQTNDVSYFSGGIARAAVEAYSILPIKYPNDPTIYGAYADQWSSNADFPAGETPHNPVHITNDVETFTNRSQVTGDVTLNVKITPELTFKSNIAIDLNFYKYNNYGGRAISTGNQGNANIDISNTTYWQNENYFNYNKTFGDHAIAGMIGLSWSRYNWENLNTSNQYFFDDFYKWHNIGIGTATRPAPSSGDGQNSLNSYFARFNYTYKGKYLFTVTGREDGSSKFGTNSKYGFFPSGSVAWRVTEEEFAKNIDALSNLKIRASVGQTGNQEIGSYVTQTFIGSGNIIIGGVVTPGLYPNSVGNNDLRWEKTTQYDAGFDMGLFKDRITMAFDYYYKLTEDMLLDVPLPQSTTTGSVKKNYGTIENKGIEVTLGTHNIKSQNFNWFSDITFSANKNKIVKLGPTGADILRNSWVGGANTILREGESVASFFGLTRLGTYSTEEASLAARYGFVPGDVKYLDKNGDGVISFVADGDILGSAFPVWDMNVSNTVEYKNFDFSLDIRFSYGAKKENRTNHSSEDRQAMANGKNSILNAWRPDHQNTMIGQVRPGNGGAYYQTYPDTHWIEDCSFIRGEGATIGYSFSKPALNGIGISKLRLYTTAKNFFVITKYTGYDPEGSDRDNMDSITPGMDFFMYPRPTTYTFGVNVIF
ncbi:MAG: TonB-dependent receptor [Prolixibacteraceae bacterium]|nr:TonB-dependent receptor [Prolixibacteraceae bacterium]